MAIERLKFRCYQCNQLLAVAPSKAGTVVSCPKCQSDLLIPGGASRVKGDGQNRARDEVELRPSAGNASPARDETESRARAEAAAILGSSQAPPKPGPVPSYLEEIAGVFPADLADLRPEDLRVEAEFFESLTRVSQASATVDPAPWPPLESLTPAYSSQPLSPSVPFQTAPETPSETSQASVLPPQTVDLVPIPSESPTQPPEVSSVVPQIEIEPPTILPAGTEIRRVSEVVLPATVVLAWSLFVLAGIAMAFVAGLLMGHFLWKTH